MAEGDTVTNTASKISGGVGRAFTIAWGFAKSAALPVVGLSVVAMLAGGGLAPALAEGIMTNGLGLSELAQIPLEGTLEAVNGLSEATQWASNSLAGAIPDAVASGAEAAVEATGNTNTLPEMNFSG